MMLQELDNYDWEEAFGEGSGGNTTKDIQAFGDASDAPAHRADVERIVYMLDGENDESDWVGLFQLNDGRYLAVVAGCDYTGWDRGSQFGRTDWEQEYYGDLLRRIEQRAMARAPAARAPRR